jgi:hypothetical protein
MPADTRIATRYQCTLLAPPQSAAKETFSGRTTDTPLYQRLLSGMQRLRGRTYFSDGAISASDLDESGHFRMSDDEQCWHLLLKDGAEQVVGCVRMRLYANTVSFEDLRTSHSSLARDPQNGKRVRAAIEADLALARRTGLSYVEVGGWALAPEWRGTKAAMDILAGSYALGELWGGCLGVATATVRHGSASILRRMGGTSLQADGEDLPPYYDPQYGCDMELLRFTRTPAQRFAPLVDPLKQILASARVISEKSSNGLAIVPHTVFRAPAEVRLAQVA